MIKNNTWKKVLQFILIEFVQNKQKNTEEKAKRHTK